MQIAKIVDRDICAAAVKKEGKRNSGYVVVPFRMLEGVGIEGKAEIRQVDLDDGTKGVLVTPFNP